MRSLWSADNRGKVIRDYPRGDWAGIRNALAALETLRPACATCTKSTQKNGAFNRQGKLTYGKRSLLNSDR